MKITLIITRVSVLFSFIILLATGCKKDEGQGGSANIKGYVHVSEYNEGFFEVHSDHDGYNENVYIIYGNDIGVSDKTTTDPYGRFEFKYLRKGNYKVYIYSKDSVPLGLAIPDVTVLKQLEITDRKQTVDAGTFEKKKVN
jgi:hypothetical protein